MSLPPPPLRTPISSSMGSMPAVWSRWFEQLYVNLGGADSVIPVDHGGTGLTTGNSGGVLGFTGATTVESSALLTASALVLGGGAGATPSTPVGLGTTTKVLHGNAGGAPSWGAVSLTADVSGTLPVGNGGTGLTSGTSGGILGFTAAATLASSGVLTTSALVLGGGVAATPSTPVGLGSATTLLHGNATGAPTWSAVSLTADVSGTLPVANGGSGIASGTSGGVLGFTGATTIASSSLLTANALVMGGGAGATPSTPLGLGTTTTVLHGNAAGAPTWGAVSLTADVSGQLPLANGGTAANLTAANGGVVYSGAAALAINTPGTSGDWLKSAGAAAPAWTNPAALTRTNDTNVTLTLGGSATTALLNAASMTLGWSGQLGLTRGGTAASLTASNGGVVYSDASALAILSGTATAGQVLRSGASAAPSWSTATYPSTVTVNQLLYGTSSNVVGGSANLTFDGTTLTNAGSDKATEFYTDTASASCATGVATTVYTLPNDSATESYLVSANLGNQGDVTNYSAFAIILVDGGTARIAVNYGAVNLVISLVGMAVKVTQSSGITITAYVKVSKVSKL